ncbi:MAG: ABC transporter ATP-binding protein [Elusimicrobiota bacterium]|jgi:putative ABC transport system ATP-binding protein|nr:ABC transporter ATP-binding protein [Elusimicrobiota bacterium]
MAYFIEAKKLVKIYERGSEKLRALDGVSFCIDKGDIAAVVGESGSGKTTLVNILGCLDNPSVGELIIDGRRIFADGVKLPEAELTRVRREIFGYIFQKFFLIPTLSVAENILLPGVFRPELKIPQAELDGIMDMLGILKRKDHLPKELSGGEMQRVAIARALAGRPKVLIADEPTGNLDSRRSDEIKDLFVRLNKERGITIILVTHNPELAKIGSRVIELSDGKIKNKF